jgi:hypothetical protein
MPIVTIARGSMWGGQAVAERTAELMDCPCIGREDLTKAAARLALSPDGLEVKPEDLPGFWSRLSWERKSYVAAAQAALAGYAAGGKLVYHGHAGHLLLREIPAILRVRVIASMDMRVAEVQKREDVSAAEAEAYIRRVDDAWVRWAKFVHGVDWRDPALYDLVINLEHVTVDVACGCIVEVARQPAFQVTPEVLHCIDNFTLASRVRLALALDGACRELELEVSSRGGSVVVTGDWRERDADPAYVERCEGMVAEAVRAVPGVESATVALRVPHR